MFGKSKLSFPFAKKVSVPGDGAASGEDKEVAEAADALLTSMSDGEGQEVAEVAGSLPTPVSGKEGEKVAGVADALLKPMGDEEGDDAAESKEVLARSARPEELSVGEDADIEQESETGSGGINDIFGQEEEKEETPVELLIASLPDVTVEELFDAVGEVKALIRAWQLDEKKGREETVGPKK